MSTEARRSTGSVGEELAACHLQRRGLSILERNFRTRWGELDVIASDGRVIVFCEVKCRRARGARRMVDPLEAVGPRKRLQVRRMAAQWLASTRERPRVAELRFDVIGVTLDAEGGLLRLDHLEAAF